MRLKIRIGVLGAILALVAGALIIILGSATVTITPLRMSDLMLGMLWILPPVLLWDVLPTYFWGRPIFQLDDIIRRGDKPDAELASKAWYAAFRMPYYSSIASGFSWVIGLGLVSWWMLEYSDFTAIEAATIAGIGLVVGPLTSIDYFFLCRRTLTPYIKTASEFLDKPVPPQQWNIWTKLLFGIAYLLVGTQAMTLIIGYYQNRSLLADELTECMAQRLNETEKAIVGGADPKIILSRYKDEKTTQMSLYLVSPSGAVEPTDSPMVTTLLNRWRDIQVDKVRPKHRDYLYGVWESLFPWSKGNRLIWRGELMIVHPIPQGMIVGVADIDNILLRWGMQSGTWVRNGFYLFLGLLLAGGLALFMAIDIARPITLLRQSALKIEEGDNALAVGAVSDDEIGGLARTFNEMRLSLSSQIKQSQAAITNVIMAVERITGTSEHLSRISRDQSSGATEQAAAIQEALTTSEEISATARQISETAKGVEQAAEQTSAACVSGMEDVGNAHQGMESIRQQMKEIADHMVVLGQHSDQIGIILDIIREISEETNLLSLNAAIEAAGAGEAGERFAVVAGEVRSLAERNRESTARIQALTDQLRNSMGKAVMAAEVGEKAVSAGYKRMQAARVSFENITQLAEGTTRASKEIAISSGQQSSASDELTGAISEVHEVSRTFLASAQEMDNAIKDLGKLSEDLRKLIKEKS